MNAFWAKSVLSPSVIRVCLYESKFDSNQRTRAEFEVNAANSLVNDFSRNYKTGAHVDGLNSKNSLRYAARLSNL